MQCNTITQQVRDSVWSINASNHYKKGEGTTNDTFFFLVIKVSTRGINFSFLLVVWVLSFEVQPKGGELIFQSAEEQKKSTSGVCNEKTTKKNQSLNDFNPFFFC